jgi:hypothetical protein
MTDNVNHPKHYTSGFSFKQPECIDFTRHMSFCRGNAFKYVWRCGLKGDKDKAIEDLKKAKWYLTHNRYTTDPTNFESLDAVFFLLQEEETHKYKALKNIVTGWFGTAIREIDEMIKEIEVSE